MGDLNQKLLLAFVAFLFGLLADVIKRAFQRDRRRVIYSMQRNPIIAVTDALPEQVRSKIPTEQVRNITNFRVTAENVGSTVVSDATVIVTVAAPGELIDFAVQTEPAKGVRFAAPSSMNTSELTISGIYLEKRQLLHVDLFVRAPQEPRVELYWSGGGGDVKWISEATAERLSLEKNFIAILRNYILAEFAPSFVTGIQLVILSFFRINGPEATQAQMGLFGVGQVIGSLLRFYFYFRVVPHAISVIQYFVYRRSPGPA